MGRFSLISTAGLASIAMAGHVQATPPIVFYTLYGDFDHSGRVTLADLNILMSNYGLGIPPATWEQGDANYDGTVNSNDFDLLQANWGQTANNTPMSPAVPFAIRFKGATTSIPLRFTEVPISSAAITNDPVLKNAHCYQVGFTLPAGVEFTCAALDVQLSTGSFYHDTNDIAAGSGGSAAGIYDTSILNSGPAIGSSMVAGNFPETTLTPVATATDFSIAWGNPVGLTHDTTSPTQVSVAQLTVVGTTLSAAQILPEPSSACLIGLLSSCLLGGRSRARH